MRTITLASVWAAAGLAACTSDPVQPPPAVASVTVTPDSAAVALFDTLRLAAVVRDLRGNVLTDREVIWNSSDPGKVVVQPTGRVQALARGTATITAESEGKSGHTRIVTVARIAVIQVTPSSVSLGVGDTLRLHALLYSSDGGPPTDSTLTWTSADTTRLTVSSTGLVRALSSGTLSVTASGGTARGTATIKVRARVASVTIAPNDASLFTYDLVSLVTIARSANGDTLTQWQELCLSGCIVTYPVTMESLDTAVARFVGCCTLQGRSAGTDTVVATADSISARAILRVSPLAFTAVSVGNYQACGLVADSTMRCWGSGHPGPRTDARRFVDVAAGEYGACALTSTGLTACQGDTTVPFAGAPASVQIDMGSTYVCGVTVTHDAWCAGAGSRGQLGSGADTVYRLQAVTVVGGHAFERVSTGVDHACAVATGGATYCWGSNGGGMLGIADTTVDHSAVPLAVAGGLSFREVSAGFAHTCGITTAGAAYCWGSNSYGQLGTGDSTSTAQSAPAPVAGQLQFVAISAGILHTCAITTAGAAYCWGMGGTLGSGPDGSNVPTPVSGGLSVLSIRAGHGTNNGSEATCARTTDGVYCWGYGITGVDGVSVSLTPSKVQGQE